tara:strand:- start:807 stop:1289 length:483 start_codon:yes stop_codon:yes gene_type:complete
MEGAMLLTAKATVTVNAAFMQEIKEVHQDLWQCMDRALTICGMHEPNPSHIVTILADLRDQVALHFALEEAYGYFEGPAHVAPRLCEKADRLRSEHAALYGAASDLVEDADEWHHQRALLHHCRHIYDRLQTFHVDLRRHETRESELVLAAYGDDIGVGD